MKGLPELLSACLHPFVTDKVSNLETKIRNRHVEFWTSPVSAERIWARSAIIQFIRKYLEDKGYLEVSTPILAHEAGGAIARPFITSASEFPQRQISLRIAPELWLKRLVLGGFEKVFEIGPCFRNEGQTRSSEGCTVNQLTCSGLDPSHNPEFTACEFYQAYANLHKLMDSTESIMKGIDNVARRHASKFASKTCKPILKFGAPAFDRLEFIPTIQSCLGMNMPDLGAESATDELLAIFGKQNITVPPNPTLPRLLDKLAQKYIEPRCQGPTFVIYQPECLSPLAKSFVDSRTGQRVAASAELYIKGQEIANMYEEENSPFEQRRKFKDALKYREDKPNDGSGEINEAYLEALEWGLPPTGGWGCGIDRLVMLFTGADRIGNVLTFGSLRNVVSQRTTKAPARKLSSEVEELLDEIGFKKPKID